MAGFWCEWAWLGGDTAVASVLLEVEDGRLVSVTAGAACAPDATRLAGLTLPGLANAHSHAFHRALRGRTQVGTGSFWTWRERMYEVAAGLDPDRYFSLARAVYGEMVLAGITCVGEFHYLHHGPSGVAYADPNAMSHALMEAASEAGLRITLLDTLYLHGGIGVEPNDVQRRFSDGSAHAWAERVDVVRVADPDMARVGAAVHSVRAVDPASFDVVREWTAANSTVVHAHVSEQPAENEQCRAVYGTTPSALLHHHGLLDSSFTAVHATHLSDHDVHLLGSARCTVCMCPTTERDLADGIGPTGALVAAGAGLSLGSDSHAVIDLFEEARGVELDERLATNNRGTHRSASLLEAATVRGHASLGWTTAGVLQPGSLADFVTLSLDSVRTAGADPDSLLETAVFAATAADVVTVVVGGRVVVHRGAHVGFDVPAELASSISAVLR